MISLIGRPRRELEALLGDELAPPYRVRQVAHWVLVRHARTFEEMTDLPRELRRRLAGRFALADPEVVARVTAPDGTVKYLFRLADGATVEAVSIPDGRKATLCLSSQTGCALGCAFCVTGALGAGRDLSAAEIVGQYRAMARELDPATERVNVVFMGMGEPLLNTAALGPALETLYETVSPRRITVSTAGVLPGIRWLAGLPRRPKLAVSLNAPDQLRRERLMPLSRAYPLDELVAALRSFPLERGRRVTFEYVLIAGVNDAPRDARAVARLIRGIPAKVNLIPLNEDPAHLPGLAAPPPERVDRFAVTLRDAGLTVTVRWSRGREVAAACGQLKGSARSSSTTNDGCRPAASPSLR